MTKISKTTLALLVLTVTIAPAQAANIQSLAQEARAVVTAYSKSMKSELLKSMESNGPVHTLDVCNIKAPEVTRTVSQSSGWDISRTSLKPRNTGNAPDAWERSILKQFEKRKTAGEDIKKMETAEVIEVGGKKTFRYMKAIPTKDVCTTCHGEKIALEIKTKLKKLYPQDKARGFIRGDIRGAFTLQKPL